MTEAPTVSESEIQIAFWLLALIPFILLFAVGVWMSSKGKLVVYRNYNDLMVVGLLYMIPAVMLAYVLLISEESVTVGSSLFVIMVVLEFLVLLFVFVRTWIDNPNPIKMLLALYVKLPAGIFFFSRVFEAFDGETRSKRRNSVPWALLMLPLLHVLVHDKKNGRALRRLRQ